MFEAQCACLCVILCITYTHVCTRGACVHVHVQHTCVHACPSLSCVFVRNAVALPGLGFYGNKLREVFVCLCRTR